MARSSSTVSVGRLRDEVVGRGVGAFRERMVGAMTAAYDHDDVHRLVNQLTPEQLGEIRAHALRLVTGRKWRFVPWREVQRSAVGLPAMDSVRFRADLDAVTDQAFLLGEDR